MTTIACDGTCIAGDGLITEGNTIHDRSCVKVFRLNHGGVVGMAGQPFFHATVLAYLNGETEALDLDGDFEALILLPNGECLCMDGKGRMYSQPAPCATGSGTPFALAAMRCGQSARQAVEIAASLDTATGGTITIVYPDTVIVKEVA